MSPRQITELRIPDRELGILRALGASSVEYLLIGGYAMRFHGSDRQVNDVDILVSRSPANADRLYSAIWHIIGHSPEFLPRELEQPNKKVALRNDGYEFDILTSVDGLVFSEAFGRREWVSQADVSISVASRSDLLFIKQVAAERALDRCDFELADIAVLKSVGESRTAG